MEGRKRPEIRISKSEIRNNIEIPMTKKMECHSDPPRFLAEKNLQSPTLGRRRPGEILLPLFCFAKRSSGIQDDKAWFALFELRICFGFLISDFEIGGIAISSSLLPSSHPCGRLRHCCTWSYWAGQNNSLGHKECRTW